MDPIQYLLDEHRAILTGIGGLRAAADDLALRGEAALPAALPVLRGAGALMETQLEQHARKEEATLFQALEAIFGADGTPTVVMRREHQDLHAQGEALRQTLRELNEVEHPAIEAGGAQLRSLAARGGSAVGLAGTAMDILRLLEQHFAKEEQVLFPMAANLLDEAQLAEVGAAIERLDSSGAPM
ncbi:MAG: hemerythrin domain-containing protein [Anaerolineales bacterium]|nr:hemerythrin domain-containing protein [Anaerolineales bacterium]